MGANAPIRYDKTAPFRANAAITGGQVVEYVGADTAGDSEGLVAATGAASDKVVGVAMHDAAQGEIVAVAFHGAICVISGGAINAGERIQSAATGRVVTLADQAVNEGGAANYTVYYGRRIGKALTTVAGAGSRVCVILGI